MPSEKFIDFLEACKCGMLCVDFYFVAMYRSVFDVVMHSNKQTGP